MSAFTTTRVQPRDDSRLADQLARARRSAADAERATVGTSDRGDDARPALAQPPERGTDQEGAQKTTINRDGKQTVIQTDKNGVTRITGEDGKVTVIDPQAIATEAAQAAERAVGAVGGTSVPPTPPPFPGSSGPPDSVIRLVGIVMTLLAIMLIGFPIARAFARRVERKPAAPEPDLARRLDRIEQAIETMAEEVERVSEAQRYSAKLLTERLPEAPARSLAAAEHPLR